jgi:putative SOS response-associated peptidase YedK
VDRVRGARLRDVCARTSLSKKTLREVAEELEAEWSPEDELLFRPRYNAAPSDTLWILRHGADRRMVASAVWGYRANGRPLINVRGENVGAGSFREAFASRRCGVVVDGFFEWNAQHEPTWFHRADGGLIVLGGLSQSDPVVGGRPRFTILTTRPNRLVAAVHDRMPLLVPPNRIDDWLTDEAPRVLDLITPAPESALVATPVSKRVNDDPECLLPVELRGETQGTLF